MHIQKRRHAEVKAAGLLDVKAGRVGFGGVAVLVSGHDDQAKVGSAGVGSRSEAVGVVLVQRKVAKLGTGRGVYRNRLAARDDIHINRFAVYGDLELQGA